MSKCISLAFAIGAVLLFAPAIAGGGGDGGSGTKQAQAPGTDGGREVDDAPQSGRGEPVTAGFVFLDGHYLPPPYVVSRVELGVFINGEEIKTDATRAGDSAAALVAQRLDLVCAAYEKRLHEGYCLFFFSDVGEIGVTPYVAAYALPSTIAILRSGASTKEKTLELERRGWHFSVSKAALQRLATGFVAPADFDRRLDALAQELLRVEEFERSAGVPIDSGFLFLDGRYVDAPYTVSRQGLGVFINGDLVTMPSQWPLPALPSGEVDPELPDTITRETSAYDDVFRDYLAAKFEYAKAHYTLEDEKDFMEAAIRSLPCVKEARIDTENPAVLHVTTFRDEHCPFSLLSVRGRRGALTRETILRRADESREGLERLFSEGRCLFIFSSGTRASISASAVRTDLPKAVAILRSHEGADVKAERLKEGPLRGLSLGAIARLVAGFSASDQLERRIADLPHSVQ